MAATGSVDETPPMKAPETRYTLSGDVNIAYQVIGQGPLDLVFIPSLTHHVELVWENPPQAEFFGRLASVSRLLLFDKRGTGMSDRVAGATLEVRMDDIRAVMDAAGSERAVLCGLGDGGPLCALFAATYPERTTALVLINSGPRMVRSPELPWLPSRAEREREIDELARNWGDPEAAAERFRRGSPSATEEERRGFARIMRLSVSPGSAAAYLRMNLDVDIRDVLPLIRVPTLVVYRTDIEFLDVRSGRYLAEHIPGAQLAELPGRDFAPQLGDPDRFFAELESFLKEVVEGEPWEPYPDRILATVLFTDIVESTARAAELGDRAWRQMLQKHHETVRSQLGRFRGKEMDTTGDGFFATFDGPARAIRCAFAIRESVRELDLEVRAGLHSGECELVDGKAGGIAVHIGARVASLAEPGEVLVSSTVKDLVAGSGIEFEDRGEHLLKGISEAWHLFTVVP
jgi:class 3 adenylate cyclase/pimeloyl-ACP methyl ester carboxylesterase